jgi:hypothetical protein
MAIEVDCPDLALIYPICVWKLDLKPLLQCYFLDDSYKFFSTQKMFKFLAESKVLYARCFDKILKIIG